MNYYTNSPNEIFDIERGVERGVKNLVRCEGRAVIHINYYVECSQYQENNLFLVPQSASRLTFP